MTGFEERREVDTVYARAGLRGRLRRGDRPGVVVIDFQHGFTREGFPLASDLTDELAHTRQLLDRARDCGLPIVYTAIAFAEDFSDAGVWGEKVPSLVSLRLGSGAETVDEQLGRRESEPVLLKRGPSGWHADGFPDWVESSAINGVVLCGATTSGCVRATATDLLQAGLPTLVVRQCVGDRATGPHVANLLDIDAKYADVVDLDDALAYLSSSASAQAPTSRETV